LTGQHANLAKQVSQAAGDTGQKPEYAELYAHAMKDVNLNLAQ
jgi:hypothetical protein